MRAQCKDSPIGTTREPSLGVGSLGLRGNHLAQPLTGQAGGRYPYGSSVDHEVVVGVGGCGVSFGDARDTGELLPVNARQANNRGELRAALRALR